MKRPLLLTPLALIALLIAAAPAQADDRQCTDTIGAVHVDGNVIVPSDASCTLLGTRVDDNVFVRSGAVLEAFGVNVGGNIQAENHRRVIVAARTVNDTVVRAHIGADIQLFDGDLGRVWQARIGGNLQVNQNSGFQEAVHNVIDGDLQAFSNTGGFRIYGNRIDGNLQCKSNDPPPVGGENVVQGNKEDQCSQLELSPPGPPPDDGTTPPDDGTTPPDDGTTPPDDGTTPPDDGTTPPDDGSIPPIDGVISNEFSFGKVKKNKRKGTAKLTVKNLPGPGELRLAKTKKVKGKEKTADEAGKEKLPIKPKGKAKKKLNRTGKAKVKAKVTYTPDGGEPNTKKKRLKLKKR